MNTSQWNNLLSVMDGELPEQPLCGFIIDSPWLPGWAGISLLEYFSSENKWLEAHFKAVKKFPDILFLPGFWSEYAMCTEPSAFGARMIFTRNQLPHAEKILRNIAQVSSLPLPDPKTDGLLPFVLQRLIDCEPKINKTGHQIRFAVARGPLNIASFLMGTSEFLTSLLQDPENAHLLLDKITRFTISWIRLQKESLPTIDGILLLDDIAGFLGEDELLRFAVPYIQRIYNAFDARVRFFHNDAHGLICSPFLTQMGVNLFNFSFEHSLEEIRTLAGPGVTLLGNMPPRDVLAAGSPEKVYQHARNMYHSSNNKRGIIWSAGGGMPPDVSTENILAFQKGISDASLD